MRMNPENWVEYLAFVLLGFGVVLSLFSGSALMSYVFVVLVGFLFARLLWRWRREMKVVFVLVAAAFLFGFTLGNIYGSRKLTVVFFLAAIWIGYELHRAGYIASLEF